MSRPELVLGLVREAIEDREIANYVPMTMDGARLRLITSRERGPYPSSGFGLERRVLRRRRSVVGHRRIARQLQRSIAGRVDLEMLLGFEQAVDDCDVVCVNESHMASSAQACALRGAHRCPPVVVVCYENIPFRYEDDATLAARKDVVREHASLFVALTPGARDALVEEGVDAARIVVQPYGVDAEVFTPDRRDDRVRASWGASADDCVVLFAGRIIPEKGVANLVRAFSAFSALPGAGARLVLVGEGGELPRLRRMTTALGVGGRVSFQPWAGPAELPAIVASADVVAVPSLPTPYWEEQLGFSAVEAMACAVPVLGVRSGSLPFVVGDAGIMVDGYDVDALGDGLARLIDDRALRRDLGARGRARVELELNTEHVAGALLSAFRALV